MTMTKDEHGPQPGPFGSAADLPAVKLGYELIRVRISDLDKLFPPSRPTALRTATGDGEPKLVGVQNKTLFNYIEHVGILNDEGELLAQRVQQGLVRAGMKGRDHSVGAT